MNNARDATSRTTFKNAVPKHHSGPRRKRDYVLRDYIDGSESTTPASSRRPSAAVDTER